jgi:hypothetical protein
MTTFEGDFSPILRGAIANDQSRNKLVTLEVDL